MEQRPLFCRSFSASPVLNILPTFAVFLQLSFNTVFLNLSLPTASPLPVFTRIAAQAACASLLDEVLLFYLHPFGVSTNSGEV